MFKEPSTGMDPQSKRKFWYYKKHSFIIDELVIMVLNDAFRNVISDNFKTLTNEKCAILTTHSMEEVFIYSLIFI